MEFNIEQARHNRDKAMAQSEVGKDDWMKGAKWAVVEVALQHEEFNTDAVWAVGLEPPEWGSARALGPVMMGAAKAHIIRNTGRTKKTAKAHSHAQPLTVWQSLIFPRVCPECGECRLVPMEGVAGYHRCNACRAVYHGNALNKPEEVKR